MESYITAYPRVVHAGKSLIAKGTLPATLAVDLLLSHVSPARSGARDATTGTERWRRDLLCFFFHAGASTERWKRDDVVAILLYEKKNYVVITTITTKKSYDRNP